MGSADASLKRAYGAVVSTSIPLIKHHPPMLSPWSLPRQPEWPTLKDIHSSQTGAVWICASDQTPHQMLETSPRHSKRTMCYAWTDSSIVLAWLDGHP